MERREYFIIINLIVACVFFFAAYACRWNNSPCSVASFRLERRQAYMQAHGTMKTWIFDNRDPEPIDLVDFEDHAKLVDQNREAKPLTGSYPS